MPPKKSNLNNAKSRAARRQRDARTHQSAEQIAIRNTAQRIRAAEGRAQESQEQRDVRLRQTNTRTRAVREQNIATARERERQRQRTSRSLTLFKMGKTNAEHCKNYYNRKKAAKEAEKIRQGFSVGKPIKKTGAERTSFQLATTSASTNRPDVSTVSSTGIADHDETVESRQVGEVDIPEIKIKEEYLQIDIKEEGVQSNQSDHVCAMDNKHEYIIPDLLYPEIREHTAIKLEIKEEILDS